MTGQLDFRVSRRREGTTGKQLKERSIVISDDNIRIPKLSDKTTPIDRYDTRKDSEPHFGERGIRETYSTSSQENRDDTRRSELNRTSVERCRDSAAYRTDHEALETSYRGSDNGSSKNSRSSAERGDVSVNRRSSRTNEGVPIRGARSSRSRREDDVETGSIQSKYSTSKLDRENHGRRSSEHSQTEYTDKYERATVPRQGSVRREREAETPQHKHHPTERSTQRTTEQRPQTADTSSYSHRQERESVSVDRYSSTVDTECVSSERRRREGVPVEHNHPTPRTRTPAYTRLSDTHSSERASARKYTDRDLRERSGTVPLPTPRRTVDKEERYIQLDAPTPCRSGDTSQKTGRSRTSNEKRTPDSSIPRHNTLEKYFIDVDADTQDGLDATARVDKKTPSPAIKERPAKAEPKKPAQRRKKKEPVIDPNQSSLLDFGYRRSRRKTQTEVKQEKWLDLEKRILGQDESHLEIYEDEVMGKGLRCKVNLLRGDFVCEYSGDLIDPAEADKRDKYYSRFPEKYGSYMYHFRMPDDSRYCVDATVAGRKGRLINHNKKLANVHTKAFLVVDTPRLCFFASRDISAGEELQYDYGDRRKDVLKAMPWLAQ